MDDGSEEFKMEVLELLDRAESALLGFDQLAPNESSPSLYDEVFRSYHNIKGGAGMMEWLELQHHVHELEDVLMKTKTSSSVPKNLIGWFLRGHDVARSIMAGESYEFAYDHHEKADVIEVFPEEKIESLPEEFYAEMNDGLERITQALMDIENDKGDVALLDALYRDIHSIKGAVQLFGLTEASALAHAMENSLEGIRGKENFDMDRAHVSTLLLCIDLMNQAVKRGGDPEMLKEVTFMASLLSNFCEEKVAPVTPKPAKKEMPAYAPQVQTHFESEKVDSTIRVQVSLLDRLMTLMGEMVLVRNQVLQYSNKTDDLEFLNLSQKLDVVTSELQEETMKTRMQPIGNVLTKFQRVVRDLSDSLEKKITLNLFGVETELDKTLIEAVKDPLTHIVRNACDHGIELPHERLKAGKSETGSITVKAYHEGGQVIVAISDDGKGLSREKLLKKALEKGIIEASRAESMSDREVQGLIFAPGFSTAEKVTNVSGRGVGMDVVKSNIEKIGGLVDISSTEGEGTKITLKIPLTLAIVPAMIIRSGADRFAIPQVKLVELVRVEKSSVEFLQGRPIYRLRGNILPLIDLREVLGTKDPNQVEESINIVVLNSETHLFGMVVDEILDTADIVVKPLARFLKHISIYSGATVLGDGNVAFIMDVQGIAQKHLGTGVAVESAVLDKYLMSDDLEVREFVLVNLGSQTKHAIPLTFVSRMEEIKTSQIELSGFQRVIRYRGGILKIVNLNELLGYPKSKEEKEITQLIVVKAHDQLFGLEVDQIIDVLSTSDLLDDSLSTHQAILGNLITQNEIIVVINVDQVYEMTVTKKNIQKSKTGDRILLVEDTISIRNTIQNDLEINGFHVEVASDGMEGLRQIANNKLQFDVIISDIEMPKMNGFEFARKVRTISQLKSTPLIAFTTKNGAPDVQEAKSAGFTTYLEKSKGRLLSLLISECLGTNKRKLA